jgi:hypothetical protein
VRIGDPMTKTRKRKHTERAAERQQIPTAMVSVEEIMASPRFARGVVDARAGRPFPADYDTWSRDDKSWSYERGRAWAVSVPRNVLLKREGKITDEAIRWFIKMDIL